MRPREAETPPGPKAGYTTHGLPGFTILLAVLLLELVAMPVFGGSETGMRVATTLAVVVLLAALIAVRVHRIAVILFVPAVVAVALNQWMDAGAIITAFRLLFLGYVTVLIIAHVLHDRTAAADTIAGAACAYLLLATVWAHAYMLVEWWRPGSFSIPSSFTVGPRHDSRPALLYFSVGLLTSVGSVIQPTHAAAAGLCAAETVVGQLYLAIMIARLVGMQVARRTSIGHS